jgi:hypothetical protein
MRVSQLLKDDYWIVNWKLYGRKEILSGPRFEPESSRVRSSSAVDSKAIFCKYRYANNRRHLRKSIKYPETSICFPISDCITAQLPPENVIYCVLHLANIWYNKNFASQVKSDPRAIVFMHIHKERLDTMVTLLFLLNFLSHFYVWSPEVSFHCTASFPKVITIYSNRKTISSNQYTRTSDLRKRVPTLSSWFREYWPADDVQQPDTLTAL